VRIPQSKPDVGEREIESVIRCVRSGQLSLGPLLPTFEQKFADFVGLRYAVATSSGTAALHLCVKALGIGEDDDAITTSFSFVASTNCLLYENAHPAFADIDPHSLNIDPQEIRNVIGRNYARNSVTARWIHRYSRRRLKAILPVHIFGLPCDMEPIIEIAREIDLHVIEDACEAVGAEYKQRRVGTFGDAACFGFYPNKQLTTAEGGMIVTNDERIANLCRSLRNQGRSEDGGWLHHEHLGYNYRLSELQCALGLAQLDRVDEILDKRERVARLYSGALAAMRGIALPYQSSEFKRSWFAYVIQLLGPAPAAARAKLIDGLHARGIDCRPYFPTIHRQPYFRALSLSFVGELPNSESAADRCLALPFFTSMSADEVGEVCSTVHDILGETDRHDRVGRLISIPPVQVSS
jgi:dTDP-4-amino-4,6-dideoxygalactose transaminase